LGVASIDHLLPNEYEVPGHVTTISGQDKAPMHGRS